VRDAKVDTFSIRIDVGDLVEGNGRVAIPEEHAPPDHDLVGMVHVALVAHVVERANVAAIERDDAKTLRVRQSRPEPEDVFSFALRRPRLPASRFAPVPPIPPVMAPANRLQALLDLSHKVSSSLALSDVLEAFVGQAAELTGASAAELSFWDRDRDCLVMLVEHLKETVEITEDGGQIYRLSDFPATRHVLTAQEPVQIRVSKEDDDPAERELLESRGQKTLLMLPLLAQGETIGMMEVIDVEDREFDRHDVDFCQALCDVVGVAVRNAMLYAEMQELAARDKLTGLYNRRLFEEQFDAAVARSLRNGEELSLLVVDLDGLKRINDLGGHPAGDEALKGLADALRASIRAGDVPCRLGGDEFAVILPGATPTDAIMVAERAQEALIARGPYSFSGGVARASANLGSIYDLYRSADIAAYRAKAAGGARTLLGVESRTPA
jgi:diguanylate cyclase (GGDEF)-like protein